MTHEDEELVTMAEARKRIAREECLALDHSLTSIQDGSGTTHAIFCERCGETWVRKS